MWTTKTFLAASPVTPESMRIAKERLQKWLDANSYRIQWNELAIGNGYGVEWRFRR